MVSGHDGFIGSVIQVTGFRWRSVLALGVPLVVQVTAVLVAVGAVLGVVTA